MDNELVRVRVEDCARKRIDNDLIRNNYLTFLSQSFKKDIIDTRVWESLQDAAPTGSTSSVLERVYTATLYPVFPNFGFVSLRTKKIFDTEDMIMSYKALYNEGQLPIGAGGIGAGFIGAESGVQVGFPDITASQEFSILIYRDGRSAVIDITVTSAATGAEVAVLTLNDVVFNIPLTNAAGDTNFTAHEIEEGANYAAFGWTLPEHIQNTVTFSNGLPIPTTGVYSFTSATAVATVTIWSRGVTYNSLTIPFTNFNGDRGVLSRFNPYKWNEYYIRKRSNDFMIEVGVFDHELRTYEPLHTIINDQTNLPLSNTTTSIGATISGLAFAPVSFSAADFRVEVKGSSFRNERELLSSYAVNKTIPASIATVLMNLKQRQHVGGRLVETESYLKALSVSCFGTKAVEVSLILNGTLSPVPTLTDYTSYEIITEADNLVVDTITDTIADGTTLISFSLTKEDSFTFDVSSLNVRISSRDTVSVVALSDNSSDVKASLVWVDV